MAKSKIMSFYKESLKNLFSSPVTTSYPIQPAEYKERTRGHIEIEIDTCISCGMCSRACPSGAIKVDMAKGTWTINRFDCIACGFCVEKCPKKCLINVAGYQEPGPEKNEVTFQISEEIMEQRAEQKRKAQELAKQKAAEMAAKKAAEAKAAAEAKPAEDK